MVQVDLPGAVAAGQILALLGRKYLEREESGVTGRLLGPVALYFSVCFAPVGLFLLVGWPAWEVMYWWEGVETPAFHPGVALFYVAFHVAMVLLGCGSFLLGARLLRARCAGAVKALAWISAAATLLPFFLWPWTWWHVGTFAQYHAIPRGTGTLLGVRSFFFSWLGIMSYLFVTAVAFGLWLRARSARLAVERR